MSTEPPSEHSRRGVHLAGPGLVLVGRILFTMALAATAGPARAQETVPADDVQRCLNCHGQPRIVSLSDEERAGMLSAPPTEPYPDAEKLFIDQTRFGRSVHAGLKCQDCHPDADRLPHPPRLAEPACATCHPVEANLYLRSVHAEKAVERGGPEAPRCATCHGSHYILPPTEREAHTYPLNVVDICTSCHAQHGTAPDVPIQGADLVERYLDSVHGRALRDAGLPVAATCPDCHGAHEVLPSHDPNSTVHRNRIPQTCGRCHVGIAEVYAESIHGQIEASEDSERAPVCTSCHTAHRISRVETRSFSRDIVEECGTCHQDLYATYRESYHGQVNRLGYRRAARCSDCHGAHDVRAVSDARSHVAPANRVETCGRCHPGATENFAKFIAHANYRDRHAYPLLFGVWLYFMILMSVTFSFFGLHTVLWWIRSVVERLRGRGHQHAATHEKRAFLRFQRIDRLTHALVITSFMGLTLTGIPLKFSDQPWALAIADALGGGNVAGILHRLFAVVMLVYVCIHATRVLGWVRAQWKSGRRGWLFGPDSLLPRKKDLSDIVGMFKWFFGLGPRPKFDRWTYWEKFDYWADAAGTVIIGGSGLVLAFPVVASWVLPGWFFNVAMIVHGYEALLAIGFIFTIHFFNAHLRLEKFPTDTVIFTGQVSAEEMAEERPAQLERLEQEGRLEELLVRPKSPRRIVAMKFLGVVLLAIGITLITLIIWAGLSSLTAS